mgnify:CR=1 FL=1
MQIIFEKHWKYQDVIYAYKNNKDNCSVRNFGIETSKCKYLENEYW